MKLCIVGHGHSMTFSQLGETIDQYPTLRMKRSRKLMNAFPRDYGTRIDYIGSTSAVIEETVKLYPEAKEYLVYPKSKLGETHPADKLMRTKTDKRFVFLEDLHQKWLTVYKTITPLNVRYSTGMGMLITALEYLKPETIYLAGFDSILNPENTDWSSTLAVKKYDWVNDPPHDFKSEYQLLQRLKNEYATEIQCLKKQVLNLPLSRTA